jgi:succinoglycan biosynthesis transport protein ExoP
MTVTAWLAPADAHAKQQSQPPAIGWSDLLRAWLRSSWIILPVALLGGAAAFAFSLTLPPVYETEAVLVLDRPSAGHLGNAADEPQPDAQQRAALVRSQIEILRGNDVVNDVIGQLHLADQPMFNPDPGPLARVLTHLSAILAELVGAPAPGTVAAPSREAQLTRLYLDHLAVRQDPDTYVLHVGFRGPDPALAARIVNTHVAAYIGWLRQQKAQAIDSTQAWLASAVAAAHARVVAAEAKVQDFTKSGVLLDIEGRTALDQGLAQLTSDLAVAQAKLVKAEARAAEIRRLQQAGETAGIAAMSGSKVLAELQAVYAQSLANTASVQSNFGPRYPVSVQARAHNQEIKAALNREIEHFVQGEISQANIARATVADLTAALERMKQQVVAAENGRSTLTRLQGEAAAERKVYLDLLEKLRSYDKVSLLAKPGVTILSPAAMPDKPRSPQRGLLAAFGFLLAGTTAAGISGWRLNRRNVVRHTSDAASMAGLRCLGVMPELRFNRRNGDIDRADPTYSFFREELRSICATLVREHARPTQGGISVLVASSLPGEGKSTFCYELGRFAAESGVRTLMVRTDLHAAVRPRGAPRTSIMPFEGDLPLYALDWTAPATILGSHDLSRSLEDWRQEFGLVIFDTPPLSAMAEGVILAPLVDATLMLARVDQTPRSLLASVTEQIAKAGGRLPGLVVTFARLSTQRGMMPSDLGYYFNQNRSYYFNQNRTHHQRLTEANTTERT